MEKQVDVDSALMLNLRVRSRPYRFDSAGEGAKTQFRKVRQALAPLGVIPAHDNQIPRDVIPGAGVIAVHQVVAAMRVVVRVEHVAPDRDIGFRVHVAEHLGLFGDAIAQDLGHREAAAAAGFACAAGANLVHAQQISLSADQIVHQAGLGAPDLVSGGLGHADGHLAV
ncbi:MAG: hypothetical protein NT090_05160, partial [Acidobacteria bacterium]|nr:hypothetical protein [Acidobacteriota bacterium]